MDAVDQKELVGELVSTGMIAPMFGWGGKMADGGMMDDGGAVSTRELNKKIKSWYMKTYPTDDMGKDIRDEITFKSLWNMMHQGYDVYEVLDVYDSVVRERVFEKLSQILGVDYDVVYNKWLGYADGGMMADGGELTEKQSAIDEALKIAQFAYENDITASGNSIEEFSNKIFDLSGISYAKAYLGLAYQAMKNQGYADGGVTGSTYVVKYSMKDTPEIVKEKIFTDKDSAELFHETISDDEDLVVMDLQEIKASPAPAPKKSLFATAKPAPATTAAAKKKRERVQVDGIADEIARYDALKATINNAKAEQEVIGGRLKEIGREKFLDLYEQRGVRPANFDLADGSENILLEVTDKYLKVEPEKAELLRQFGGLLEEKTTYEFDSEILEKEVSDGMTIGDVVSMLIQDSKLIPDSDKANLIKAKMSMRVPKGTLDRLMDYDNPREVFSLISPILALK